MRKILFPLVGLLLVAGCSGSADPTATPLSDQALLEQVKVRVRANHPEITLPTTPFSVETNVARMVTDGDGDALADGQEVLVRQLVVAGTDGSTVAEEWADPSPGLVVGQTPMINTLLSTAHVGAQILVATPEDNVTYVVLLEIAYAVPPGEPVAEVPGLPTVTVDDEGLPAAVETSGSPPSSLVVQPLVAGTGPQTEAGRTVLVRYTGWLWDGTMFDSSRGRAAFTFTLGAGKVIAGWDEGLVGQSVGSRVLLVIPPELGYGDQDQGTIPPGSTLVFVVDILAMD
ncbi:MAG: FKBP-type peptidyl-prolyl cis-trans isomerase [Micrococcales bacterium]|nr:FKBP-type peptidyl-prolyl cis-trans isomerase [Micrococcales bacterium]MCL2667741.1 FKBP-type peptidyl-prolyl cis-trans isomerase [Micrococcales bacterium]